MEKAACSIQKLCGLVLFIASGSIVQSVTFSYTGNVQYFRVPANAVDFMMDIAGASGYGPYASSAMGGRVISSFTLTPSIDIYAVYVGGAGSSSGQGGYNGGGSVSGAGSGGCGGGGASDVRTKSTSIITHSLQYRLIVGGGGGGLCNYGGGGKAASGGGNLTGGNGVNQDQYSFCVPPTGGSQNKGGSGGSCNGYVGHPGQLGIGGNGYSPINTNYNTFTGAGGGGGGYYGGGGGGFYQSGGGGSSYSSGVNTIHFPNYWKGNGYVTINITGCVSGYAPDSSFSSCIPCSAGSFSSDDRRGCQKCFPGTYSPQAATECTSCPAGTTSRAGAAVCCALGTTSSPGSSVCAACDDGYIESILTTSGMAPICQV